MNMKENSRTRKTDVSRRVIIHFSLRQIRCLFLQTLGKHKKFSSVKQSFSRCLLSVGSDKRQIVSDRSKVMEIMICWTCDLFGLFVGLTIFCTTLLRIVKFNEKTQNGNSDSANFSSFFCVCWAGGFRAAAFFGMLWNEGTEQNR